MAMCSRGTPPFWHSQSALSPPSRRGSLPEGFLRRDSTLSTTSEILNAKDNEAIQRLWNECQELKKRPDDVLHKIAEVSDVSVDSVEFANFMDENDPLRPLRGQFAMPKMRDLPNIDIGLADLDDEAIYLCGHSLGLKPWMADQYIREQLTNWGKWGVHMHHNGRWPAALCDQPAKKGMGRLVGAEPEEVGLMNGLTVNIHVLLTTFYRPSQSRFKILMEEGVFSSDLYAAKTQVQLHNYSPSDALILLRPRPGEFTLRNSDILDAIENEGDSIAVVFLNVVDFRTGQVLDAESITSAAREKGCLVGWDLAHAVGNVQLFLHNWDVDFACWCTYKYLNSGAGGMGGIFVHRRHHDDSRWRPRLQGWWSGRPETRFDMLLEVDLADGADAFRLSNPSPWHMSLLMASLRVFEQTSIEEVRGKQRLLTGYLELLLNLRFRTDTLEIVTPRDSTQRGAQLTLFLRGVELAKVFHELERRGVTADMRPPAFLRVAPVPLYNTFKDVYRFVLAIEDAITVAQH